MAYNEDKIKRIIELREDGYDWKDVKEVYNEEFDESKTVNALRKTYKRNTTDEQVLLTSLKSKTRATSRNRLLTKELKTLSENAVSSDAMLHNLKKLAKEFKIPKYSIPKYRKLKKKKNMTKELMLTDLHFGKKTNNVDEKVIVSRLDKLVKVFIAEVYKDEKDFNVEELVIFLGGDIVESATMHGAESLAGCEYENMEQIRVATKVLFNNVLVPILHTGRKVSIKAVPGNHDRIDKHETYVEQGTKYMSWVIYNMLGELCKVGKFKNIKFDIARKSFLVGNIYNNVILWEHGRVSKSDERAFNLRMGDVSRQVGKMIDFYRCGHFHSYLMLGNGTVVRNASLIGQDGYAEEKGFSSVASQTINSYVETKHRPNCFYQSFPVYLED